MISERERHIKELEEALPEAKNTEYLRRFGYDEIYIKYLEYMQQKALGKKEEEYKSFNKTKDNKKGYTEKKINFTTSNPQLVMENKLKTGRKRERMRYGVPVIIVLIFIMFFPRLFMPKTYIYPTSIAIKTESNISGISKFNLAYYTLQSFDTQGLIVVDKLKNIDIGYKINSLYADNRMGYLSNPMLHGNRKNVTVQHYFYMDTQDNKEYKRVKKAIEEELGIVLNRNVRIPLEVSISSKDEGYKQHKGKYIQYKIFSFNLTQEGKPRINCKLAIAMQLVEE